MRPLCSRFPMVLVSCRGNAGCAAVSGRAHRRGGAAVLRSWMRMVLAATFVVALLVLALPASASSRGATATSSSLNRLRHALQRRCVADLHHPPGWERSPSPDELEPTWSMGSGVLARRLPYRVRPGRRLGSVIAVMDTDGTGRYRPACRCRLRRLRAGVDVRTVSASSSFGATRRPATRAASRGWTWTGRISSS